MTKKIILIILVAVLLSGCVSDKTSDKAVTQEDRQWIYSNNNDYNTICSYFSSANKADQRKDYEAIQEFGVAVTKTTDQSMQRSLNTTVSPGLKPAQKAWESCMRQLNSAGWELLAYGNSYGSKEHSSKCVELESDAVDCYLVYSDYL